MVGGMVGALLLGLFATTSVNEAGADGLLYGNAAQFGRQAIAVGITLVFSFIATLVIVKITDVLVGVRITEDQENVGLDLTQHSESAYTTFDVGVAPHPPPAPSAAPSTATAPVQATALENG